MCAGMVRWQTRGWTHDRNGKYSAIDLGMQLAAELADLRLGGLAAAARAMRHGLGWFPASGR